MLISSRLNSFIKQLQQNFSASQFELGMRLGGGRLFICFYAIQKIRYRRTVQLFRKFGRFWIQLSKTFLMFCIVSPKNAEVIANQELEMAVLKRQTLQVAQMTDEEIQSVSSPRIESTTKPTVISIVNLSSEKSRMLDTIKRSYIDTTFFLPISSICHRLFSHDDFFLTKSLPPFPRRKKCRPLLTCKTCL